MEHSEKSPIILITGATGAVGSYFLNHFLNHSSVKCLGLSRTISSSNDANFEQVDLYDNISIMHMLRRINISAYKNIYYLHCVGLWDFEEFPPAEPDPAYFHSNVTTFNNFSSQLLSSLPDNSSSEQSNVTFCCFGSIADKYNVKYYKSSSHAKKLLKEQIKVLTEQFFNIRGVVINLSTLRIEKEICGRPFSKMVDYWLDPEVMVSKSIEFILKDSSKFIETEIFKPFPLFNETFFNDGAVYERRMKEKYM